MNSGKCPKCDSVIREVLAEDVSVKVGMQGAWKGLSFSCSKMDCRAVLGISINPLTLKADMVRETVDGVKALLRVR